MAERDTPEDLPRDGKITRRRLFNLGVVAVGGWTVGSLLNACIPKFFGSEPAPSPVVFSKTPQERLAREQYFARLTPEQQQLFLTREKDAQAIISEWIAPQRLKDFQLLPENIPTNTNVTTWVLEEPTHNTSDSQTVRAANLRVAYNETTKKLSYFKMNGSIASELSLLQQQTPEATRMSLSDDEKHQLTYSAIERFLIVPSGASWKYDQEVSTESQGQVSIPRVSTRGVASHKEFSLSATYQGSFSLTVTNLD